MPQSPSPEQILSDNSVRIMRSTLEDLGLDPMPAFAIAGIDPCESNVDRRISRGQERAFQRAFIAMTGREPTLWLRMGMHYSLACFGPFSLMMMTSPNLRALLTAREPGMFGFHGIRLKPILFKKRLMGIEFDASVVPEDLRELSLLVSCGCALRLYPELVGEIFSFSMISLPFPETDLDTSRLPPAPFKFDAERTMLLWPDEMSEFPLRNANPVLHRSNVEAAARLLKREDSNEHLKETILSILSRNLKEPASLEEVANELGMTTRTLQRRLTAAGVKFRNLIEVCRRESAIHLLAFSELPLTNVAFKLGYKDLTSFSHAFQRWSAIPPSLFRRKIREDETTM